MYFRLRLCRIKIYIIVYKYIYFLKIFKYFFWIFKIKGSSEPGSQMDALRPNWILMGPSHHPAVRARGHFLGTTRGVFFSKIWPLCKTKPESDLIQKLISNLTQCQSPWCRCIPLRLQWSWRRNTPPLAGLYGVYLLSVAVPATST
jgi:hypothetical protein